MKQQVIINNRREEVRGKGTGGDGVVFDTVVRESLCGSDIQVMTGMKGKNKALMIWENSFQDQGYRKSQGPEVGRSLKVSRKSKERLKVCVLFCCCSLLAGLPTSALAIVNSLGSNQST